MSMTHLAKLEVYFTLIRLVPITISPSQRFTVFGESTVTGCEIHNED